MLRIYTFLLFFQIKMEKNGFFSTGLYFIPLQSGASERRQPSSFFAVGHRWLFKSLAAAQLLNDAGLFKLTFEFLKCSFDVLAFFYLYDNHFGCEFIFIFVIYLHISILRGKITNTFSIDKTF